MAKKKDDKYRGHFDIPPKSKGGRRRQKPISESQSRALATGRRKWTPGCPSPNPSGRPRQHKELVDFYRLNMDEIDARIMETLRKEELTKSDEIRLKGLFQAKEFAFGKNPASVMVTGLDAASVDGSGVTALLLRAQYENAKKRTAIEAKPGVFIADASGNVAAPLPESAPDPELDPAERL